MTDELVKFGGGVPANPEDLIAGLQNVGQALTTTTGGLSLLRLLKSGVFAYGPENIEPQPGSHWAMNPSSLAHGWACWGDGDLLDERMVPHNQNPPVRGELPDLGHAWAQQVSMQLQCLNGEDTGTVVLYKGTALGLRNAIKDLINALIRQLQTDPQNCVPVLELNCDSYKHKKHGQIFFPVLNIVRWISYSGESVETPAAVEEVEGHELPDDEGASPEAEHVEAGEREPEPEAPPASNRRRRRRTLVDDKSAGPESVDAPDENEGEGETPTEEAAPRRRRRRAQ